MLTSMMRDKLYGLKLKMNHSFHVEFNTEREGDVVVSILQEIFKYRDSRSHSPYIKRNTDRKEVRIVVIPDECIWYLGVKVPQDAKLGEMFVTFEEFLILAARKEV